MEQKTKLLYLEDTFKLSDFAEIIEIGSDEKGTFIVLDKTIFYPQGGGQPTDFGIIKKGNIEVRVSFVGFLSGVVYHYIDPSLNGTLNVGDIVELQVSEKERIINAKCHSAGHLISSIIEKKIPGTLATKGFHFSVGPYIEFDKAISFPDETAKKNFINEINTELQNAIDNSVEMKATLVDYKELVDKCPNIPSGIPKDKPLRIASILGYPSYPCGGTHVTNFRIFNKIEVTNIKNREGRGKVSYSSS